jgi:excisionase family DNA binding protein
MDKSTEKRADESTMLTVHEVAQYLRMSEAKVYRLVKEGRIPVIHIGRAWRFRKDLLDKWLVQCAELSLKGDNQSNQNQGMSWLK